MFLQKTGLLLFLVASALLLTVTAKFLFVGSQYNQNYQAAFLDKIERLKSIDEPKIILVGNSNLSFGIDSQKLQDSMGMPVVNLGLHGGLGNAFHRNMAKYNIRKDDIVVLCQTSYGDDDDDEIHDYTLAWITIDNHLEYLGIFRPEDYAGLLSSYPTYLKKALYLRISHKGNLDYGGSYSRNAFNKYGDVIVKPAISQLDFSRSEYNYPPPTVSDQQAAAINDYNRYVASHGAELVIASYPILFSDYSVYTKDDIIAFQKELEEKTDCDLISDFTDYLFPCELFYNTNAHLTEEGTAIRTELLISDLKRSSSFSGFKRK